jgi:predicted nucleic-acid-binding Zn-ribbon protein
MDADRSQQIIDALKAKGANLACPRCEFTEFDAVAESYLPIAGTGNWFASDDTIPIAVTACRRCGYMSQHALGRLLEPQEVSHAGTSE